MAERVMSEDNRKTVIAIKHHYFDEYWKERCLNSSYLTTAQKYGVISQLALEVFNKSDWAMFQHYVSNSMNYSMLRKRVVFKKKRAITLKQMLQCYISAIDNMQMVYKD